VTKRNSEIVRQLYGAFNEADWASATALADPDLVWVPDPRVGVGPIEGADDALRFFRDRAEMFDEFSIEVERLEEAGNKVVAMLRTSGRGEASGAEFENQGRPRLDAARRRGDPRRGLRRPRRGAEGGGPEPLTRRIDVG